jgi:hypothetical protein
LGISKMSKIFFSICSHLCPSGKSGAKFLE